MVVLGQRLPEAWLAGCLIVFDFLALNEIPAETLTRILERAVALADCWRQRRMPRSLDGVRVGLIVDDGGWRNTTAFDLGIQTMGGICVNAPVTLGGKEDVADLANYLDNWFDLLVVRTPDLSRLRALALAARAPVVNARTRSNHPCETLGDLAFVLSVRDRIEGLRVAVVAPDDNILASWAEAAAVLPIEVVQVYPRHWHAKRFEGTQRFSMTEDLSALAGADVVITDCWPKDGPPDILGPYRLTAGLLRRLAPEALFIPCPPVTRGEEVSADAMERLTCRVVEAKAFLLHAQNALLEEIVSGR